MYILSLISLMVPKTSYEVIQRLLKPEIFSRDILPLEEDSHDGEDLGYLSFSFSAWSCFKYQSSRGQLTILSGQNSTIDTTRPMICRFIISLAALVNNIFVAKPVLSTYQPTSLLDPRRIKAGQVVGVMRMIMRTWKWSKH